MIIRRTFTAMLLGCTMLAGCNGSDDKSPTPASDVSQNTFPTKPDARVAELQSTVATLQAELAKARLEGKTPETAVVPVVVHDTSGAKEAELQAIITGLQAELAKVRAEDKTVENASKIAELQNALETLTQSLKATQATSAALTSEVALLKAPHIEELKKAIVALQPTLEKATENNASLRTLEDYIEKLEARLSALEGNASSSDEDKAELVRWRSALTEVRSAISDLAKDFEKVRANIAPLLEKVQSVEKQLQDSTISAADLKTLTTQTQKLKTDIDAALVPEKEKISTFSQALEEAQKDFADVQGLRVDQPLASYVNTTRGSAESGSISKGNNFPATALPFGFNMWSPVNTTADQGVIYDATPGKNMNSFAVTHMASKWNGNRQALKIMPVKDENVRLPNYAGEPFQRKNEVGKAHYYSVIFDNQMKTEITPTDHAAYFRFTAPDSLAKTTVAFDTFADKGALKVNQAEGTASGYALHGSNDFTPRMYFFIKFDSAITKYQENISSGDVRAWVQFDTPAGAKVVGMRIATSFISEEQAKDNLEQEIAGKSFDDVLRLAEDAWNKRLNTIHVQGATEDQKIILYSNMYRSFLYPNSAWENVRGADGKSTPTYVSPYTNTDKVKPGKIWVNNGFWDTYRANWPLYSLLMPNETGEMLNGFVNGYKDGGWTSRWSNPGYRDSMVATSTDIVLADAYLKGIRNFDVETAYASMLRNATNYSRDSDKGRRSMDVSIFRGYTPTGTGNTGGTSRSVAWSLEGYLNDFGIAQMAKELKKDGKTGYNYGDEQAYFASRSLNYVNLFDPAGSGAWAGGWFRGKNLNGAWDNGSTSAQPHSWGYGYEEGNAWSYAFLAPQDGQGLANLYGGRDKLKEKLDKFFTTTPRLEGGDYGSIIHEVREAAEVHRLAGVGEYQHSNQTVHHSIYMYNYAGSPATGQKYLRDVMDKLYFTGFDANGVSDGSGYIGDEDNGEMSSWYILSAMGVYPVSMGRPEYAIGAPYFPRMTVRLKTIKNAEKTLTIRAPSVSSANRYVQSVKLNGKPVLRNYILHSEIADGATLDFVMGPNPSQWGSGVDDVPTSITKGDAKPKPSVSLLQTGFYDGNASNATQFATLFDKHSGTGFWNSGANGWVELWVMDTKPVSLAKMYTLTSIASNVDSPKSWTVKGSEDGTTWEILDQRKDEIFKWGQQTRPFSLNTTKAYKRYRIEFDGAKPANLAELELLGETP